MSVLKLKSLLLNSLFSTLFFSICLIAGDASAQMACPLDSLTPKKVASLEIFKRIPLLNYGRIKPIETYARNFLVQLSSRSRYEKETAIEWFSRFLFAPRTTYADKIFLINNPEILEAIQIVPEKRRRYSYKQLESGFEKIKALAEVVEKIDDKERSVVEREILRVYNNFLLYIRLSGAFSYGFPHPDFTIESAEVRKFLNLDQNQKQYSFYDMFERMDLLEGAASSLSRKKQEEWTENDYVFAGIINALFFWTEHYKDCPLGLIPTRSVEDEHWLSPMDVIVLNDNVTDYMNELKYVRDMVVHYWNGEQLQFDLSAKAFINSITNRVTSQEKEGINKISLELIYNKLNLFSWVKILYILGIFFFLGSLFQESKFIYSTSILTTILGFLFHISALILRILIMSRPPVTNLYETFIFVGAIAVILGGILEIINKNGLGLFVANLCGAIFLVIAEKFASEGDTMQMLVAVLNSNFWLSTHVLTITIGYAGCCVAGIVGHIYIFQALIQPNNKQQLNTTLQNMLGILGFGLTMTFLGTALGGIWADQSWGRFWGWDPKENGALLIVLWAAGIFHARLAKLIHPLGVAIGCVLGLIVVMWAWFGVNLLSVGLHSYGFTSGIANVLIMYVVVELIFTAVAAILLGRKNIKI
ncbi:MAG: cytochrome c biogenesis protein CcsA [Candidatus Omnitrophica bacterium]|nr:cytochrome c biogenesis protein CcsA [Candidatus Omnitrophota bacterium]